MTDRDKVALTWQVAPQFPNPADGAIQPFYRPGAVVETTLLEAPKLKHSATQMAKAEAAIAWGAHGGVGGFDDEGPSLGRQHHMKALTDDEYQCGGHIELERWKIRGAGQLMGRCWRNAITGEIVLRPGHCLFPDFSVVDTYRRCQLPNTVKELRGDPHLFKPVVLTYRTWVYHELMRSPDNSAFLGGGDDGMVRSALSARCVDVPMGAGRYSPLCWFAPVLLAVGLTGDEELTVAAVAMAVGVVLLSYGCNRAFWSLYRLERIFSLFVRVPFIAFVLTRMQFRDALAIFGYAACIVAFLVDIYYGDYKALDAYKWHCHYQILSILPGRIYVCRRVGAPEMQWGAEERVVDQAVAGFAPWEPSHALIADIGGILCELRPMREEDWDEARNGYFSRLGNFLGTGMPPDRKAYAVPYVGLDMCGPEGGQGPEFMDDKDWNSLMDKRRSRVTTRTTDSSPLKAAALQVEDM